MQTSFPEKDFESTVFFFLNSKCDLELRHKEC